MTDSEQLVLNLEDEPGSSPSRRRSWEMFDRIASRYDVLNRVLSARRDVAWRRKVADHLPEGDGLSLLDLATGTADQILTLFRVSPRVSSAVGLDMAQRMIDLGRQKVAAAGLSEAVELRTGDALDLPFEDNHFDAVSISFGIRNVEDVSRALCEMNRVLKPGGRAIILEFSLPSGLLRPLYLFYLRHVLPRLGALVSGDAYAYRYLNRTIESFPSGEAFAVLMGEAGFKDVRVCPLTFGVASIYEGTRS